VEQIEEFWRSPTEEYLLQQEKLGWDVSGTRRLQALLKEGKPICDKDGVILSDLVPLKGQL
jgi:hypothetical protein